MPLRATDLLRPVLRPAVRAAREVPVWARAAASPRGRGPVAVLLPAYGREASALLRIYNLATPLRAAGWRVHVLPWRLTLAQRRRVIAALSPDVVLMQGVRHELNRPALYPGQRIVLDIDDADFHLDHLEAPLRAAMPRVAAVIAGSGYVARWCRGAGAGEVQVVWTGTPVSAAPRPPHATRPPIVAWAQSRPETYRREAAEVCALMARVAAAVPGVRLRLYDRQPGQGEALLAPFRAAGITVEWLGSMPYDRYLASFDDVAVGWSPIATDSPFSRGKSFGKVLAYLDRHVPVVASDAAEHGAFFTAATGVISNDRNVWVGESVALLGDPDRRAAMAAAAFTAFRTRLSVEAAAARVAEILQVVSARNLP